MEAEMDTAAAEDGANAAAPAASAAAPPAGPPAVVIDSGAYSTKVGFAGQDAPTRCMPSVVAREGERRKYVGDAVSQCADPSGLAFRRPCEKGYVMNWDVTQELWDRAFGAEVLGLDAAAIGERALLVTEPQFNHEPLQDTMDQLVFELYGFKEYHCTTAAMLSDVAHRHTAAGADALASVVVDAGYSFTHAVPIFDATKVNYAVKRVDVGGKILTNYLAELCQHREYNLMDETYLVDQLKQVMCYVSGNFDADMKAARVRGKGNTIRRHFVLPDYRAKNHGYVRGDSSRVWNDARATQPDPELRGPEQEITLNIERFTAPELLFNPSDIGFEQGGVVDAIEQAINALPVDLREPAVGNVLLTGGNALIPGFADRVERELRAILPDTLSPLLKVHLLESTQPLGCGDGGRAHAAWRGGSILAASADFSRMTVTKEEYEEYGHRLCRLRNLQPGSAAA
jgi:actin-related protein 6